MSIAPNQKARKLKEHIDIVLLKLIGSNVADISRVEVRTERQTNGLMNDVNVVYIAKLYSNYSKNDDSSYYVCSNQWL